MHERTHRNDRPFECNICHQKFYRKEPMQKHQWRQHGVVHFKARPHPAGINTTGPPTAPLLQEAPSPATAESPLPAAAVLYNSIVDRIKYNSLETMGESSRHLDGAPEGMLPPPPPPPPPPPRQQQQPSSPQSGPEDLSNHHRFSENQLEEPDDDGGGDDDDEQAEVELPTMHLPPPGEPPLHLPPPPPERGDAPSPLPLNAKLLTALPGIPPPPPAAVEPAEDEDDHRPIKLKKLLAHAYQKEVEEAESLQLSHLQRLAPLPPTSQDDFTSSSEESSSSSAAAGANNPGQPRNGEGNNEGTCEISQERVHQPNYISWSHSTTFGIRNNSTHPCRLFFAQGHLC